MAATKELFSVTQIARRLNRTHRSVGQCIERLGIQHEATSGGRLLFPESVIARVRDGLRNPNREAGE